MCRFTVFVFLLTGLTVSALEMVIEIEDDDGHREKYNISEELEELMKDHLPFDVPDEDMDEEYKTKLRPRRDTATVQDQVPWNRNLPECETYIQNYRKQNRGAPLQLMYSVEENEHIVLTCHYCGDKETYGKTIEWKKLDRKKAKGRQFRIVRIDIDMHDDDKDNRVFIDEEYGLHIKNATTADRGTYFCHDMKTRDVYVKKYLDVSMLKKFFFSSDRFRVFFHLEVIQETDIPIRKVDSKGIRFSKPFPEQVSKQDNLVYYTSWGDWTPCSVCGAEGERKRRGTCMARLYSVKKMIRNFEQLYYILRSYKAGLPCRSSLFERYYYSMSKYRDRPDEMEYKSCHVQCWSGGGGGKKFASVKLDKIQFHDVMKRFPETTVIATEGDRVDLICPGSSIDTLVYWINGTKYMSSLKLREKTSNRVEIDAYNVFVIHTSLIEDSHSYTCSYAGRTRMIFHLKVLPPPGLLLTEANLGNIANSLKVGYNVGRNGLPLDLGPGQRITTYLANITLENIGQIPIQPNGWSLYMCHEKLIHPMFYNISGLQFAGGGLILPGNVTVIHIKGCMFSFTPYLGEDPRFKAQPLQPGQTLIIPIVASEFLVSRYSVYPNWYIADRSLTKLIPNTMDNDRKFVGPFEHNIQYTRYINDLDSIKLSPIDRYRGYRFLSKPETKFEILPTPFKKNENTGSVSLNGNWLIDYNGVRNLANIATYLQSSIKGESGLSLRMSNVADGTRKVIQILRSNPAASTNPEAYTLQVNPRNERIVINGFSNAAVINGIHTLRSLLAGGRTIKSMTINDQPRFPYRGLELDLASNYFPPSTVKKVIDVMALYKLNKLVLILGEENGWRIEIPEIPSLTKIGGKRCHDPSENSCLFSQLGSKPDGSDGGYLTVQNYQDLLKYAAVRNIEIIPQIHMGSKARAAIKAMRVHLLTTKDKSIVLQDPTDIPRYMTSTLYSDSAVNPCLPNDSTVKFFEFILTKLKKYHYDAGVPLKYVHVGGDDSPPPAWLNSTHCQRLRHLEKEDLYLELKVNYSMALGDLATKHGVGLISLEEFFMAWPSRLGPPRIVPFLTPFNRTRFGNTSDIISVSKTINQFPQRRRPQLMANSGYKVILQPSDYTSLEFAAEPDSEMPGEYDSRIRHINATKVFNFLPENLCCNFELTDAGSFGCTVHEQCEPLTEKDNILGMQASLSTRFVKDEDTLFKLLLPRLIPFAERAYHKAKWENTYLPPQQIFNPQTGPEVIFAKPDLVARDKDWTRVASIIGNKEYPRLVNFLNVKPNVLPPGAKKEKMGTRDILRVDTSYPGLTPQIKSSLADWSNIKNATDVTTLKLKDFQMRTLFDGKQNRRLESIEQTMPLVYLSLKQEILSNVTKIRREMELERQRQMQAAQEMELRRRQALLLQQQQASQFARAQMGTGQFNQFGMPQQPAQQGSTGVINQQTGTAQQAVGTPVQQNRQFTGTG